MRTHIARAHTTCAVQVLPSTGSGQPCSNKQGQEGHIHCNQCSKFFAMWTQCKNHHEQQLRRLFKQMTNRLILQEFMRCNSDPGTPLKLTNAVVNWSKNLVMWDQVWYQLQLFVCCSLLPSVHLLLFDQLCFDVLCLLLYPLLYICFATWQMIYFAWLRFGKYAMQCFATIRQICCMHFFAMHCSFLLCCCLVNLCFDADANLALQPSKCFSAKHNRC